MARKLTNKFWEYEMGAEMQTTVDAWDHYIETKNWKDAYSLQSRWDAFKISFRYIFGMNINFTRTDEYYGICDDDENFFYKVER